MDRWFGGDSPCTRIKTVTYLCGHWQASPPPTPWPLLMPDDADSAQAVEKGITSGTIAATFAPDAICTRGQIMTFLYLDMAQ